MNRAAPARGVEAAPDGLPVDGDVLARAGLGDGFDPLAESLLKLVGVERGEDTAEGVMRRDAVRKVEK